MVEVVVEVKDKGRIKELKELGPVIHISQYINMIIMEVAPPKIKELESNPNVLSVRRGQIGKYQMRPVTSP